MILSITPFNQQFRTVGVVPLSSTARPYAPVSAATPSVGTTSVALCYQLRAIDKTRLGKYMGDISASDLVAIEMGVKQVYGLV